ncbi:hypothetical protein AAFF_G00355480 [Aldrovandia affinis]|uniref:MAP7 domain-containing protein 1-like n=1 Tax=Aldrovandia affinis TaxID=143900 RepID=A0AAD7R5I4_9TELE|nr:hypothetical protein AAFF_G00355480 [Aldrovandia affinis]
MTTDSSKHGSLVKTDGPLAPTSRKVSQKHKKADGPKLEERLKLAKERREERAKYLEQRTQQQAAKRAQWLEKEVRARQQRERQLNERRKRLEEQRLRAERRRALLQEKDRQKLEKNKERYEAAVRRSAKKTWAEIRQLRWSWAGGLNQTSSRETRSLQLSARESRIVERLMTPTLSFLARSRSSTTLLNSSKDSHSCLHSHSASPLTACAHHCAGRQRVSASTPDIRQRPRRLEPILVERKKKKEKKDKERENEREKALGKGKEQKPRRTLKPRAEPSAPGSKTQLTPQNTPSSPSPTVSLSGPKTRRKRSNTPARVQLPIASPVTMETVGEPHQSVNPEGKKSSTSVPSIVVSTDPSTAALPSAPITTATPTPSPLAPCPSTLSTSTSALASLPTGGRPTAGTTDPEQAARSLAEKRRQVREEREREEQERREQEERNRVLREEREAWEVEERRCREEEAQRAAEEQQSAAQRLEEAAQEESERLQKIKEEEAAKAREEAERQRQERNRHFQREEEERMERKKRLEEIMKRTRKAEGGEKNDAPLQQCSSAPRVDGKDAQRDAESSLTPTDSKQNPDTTQSNRQAETVQSQGSMKESPLMNGVQTANHHNGLSDLEIIQLASHTGGGNEGRERSESGIPSDPIPALDSGEAFLMKTGSLKAQHIAGVL